MWNLRSGGGMFTVVNVGDEVDEEKKLEEKKEEDECQEKWHQHGGQCGALEWRRSLNYLISSNKLLHRREATVQFISQETKPPPSNQARRCIWLTLPQTCKSETTGLSIKARGRFSFSEQQCVERKGFHGLPPKSFTDSKKNWATFERHCCNIFFPDHYRNTNNYLRAQPNNDVHV